MNKLKDFLILEEDKLNWKMVLLFILIAYVFNIAVRYIYISYMGDIPQLYWNGHLIINNPDGFAWAEGARDILAGFHQQNDLSRIDAPASYLIAFFAKLLPFVSFDVLLEYLPGFLGALIVIPIILIGRVLGSAWAGFLAALLSGMAWSYYHRTMFGYLDTDMLIIVLPVFALWRIIWSLKNKDKRFFFLAPLVEILMLEWHGGLFNVANGFFIMAALYAAIFSRDKDSFLFLLFLIIPVLPLAFLYKLIVLAVLYGIVLKINVTDKVKINVNYILLGVIGIYILTVGFPWIMGVLKSGYFTRAVTNTEEGLKYFSVVNTVREAGHISYDTLVHRISGSWLGFVFGAAGYILLSIRYPVILISLPMVVLGLFAIRGGLRFTIFAVPFFAIGNAYIAYLTGKLLSRIFISDKVAKSSVYVISFFVMAGFIYPNYKHIHQYLVPSTISNQEVVVLDKLKHIANRNDYVLTWWDYGYAIRYYADVKTLADGGKHSGEVNFPVSFALTRNLLASRNMAVLDVFQTEYNYKHNKESDYLKDMMQKYNFKDPNKFLAYASSDKIKLPQIKKDIYYYLPLRMMNIFPTVAIFSNVDLKTGKRKNHFFFKSDRYQVKSNVVYLIDGIRIDLNKGVVIIGRQLIPIKILALAAYDKNGKLQKSIKKIHSSGLNVVYMKSYGKWLIMDDFYFNSAYIQLFVFENTQGLFEPVILNPLVKVYKVKK